MISYAQNFEDVILWRAFRNIGAGHYVDVGAFHPEIDSVTKRFYDHGWSGINVEPVPESFALLQEARPRDINICAAAGEKAGVGSMTVYPESRGLSSLRPADHSLATAHVSISVEVLPLEQMLKPYEGSAIHFLKIDAEGTEREVLLGMNFERFRPWVILVEATEPQSSKVVSAQWRELLISNRYEHVYFDGLNEFFIAEEHSELRGHFQVPPNVFDDFELAATVRERQWRNEMETALRSDIGALQNERSALHEERAVLQRGMASLQSELASLQSGVVSLQTEVASLGTQLSSSQWTVDRLSGNVAELSQALKISRETIEAIFRSRSWRWLAPIRGLNAYVRSYRQKLRLRELFRDDNREPT